MNDVVSPKSVLIACDYYLPGFKAGGSPRTVANLVDRMGDECSFHVMTRDRDFGDTAPYPESHQTAGRMVGKARVLYLSPPEQSFRSLMRKLEAIDPDILQLNSFFSVPFTIKFLLLRWLRVTRTRPVIIACRGEFSRGALAIRPVRKRLYIAAVRLLGICRDVVWQASSPFEEQDIRRLFGKEARVVVARDLPATLNKNDSWDAWPEKVTGKLRVLFLSRISPIKNLHGALALLKGVAGEIQFNIYGPIEDARYWEECRRLIGDMPPNVRVEYHGAIPYGEVDRVFAAHDLFFLPSLGENFCHVILESLNAGCPVLTSDRTPWRGLEQAGAGWDLSLDHAGPFRAALETCTAMGPREYKEFRRSARKLGLRVCNDEEAVDAYRALFAIALE